MNRKNTSILSFGILGEMSAGCCELRRWPKGSYNEDMHNMEELWELLCFVSVVMGETIILM